MRYLAIDLGDKRTGLAVGDVETRIATPLDVLELPLQPGDRLITAIVDAIDDQGAHALVLGLPFNMDGTEGPRAKLVRDFASRLEERVSLPIHYEDERLTSADADWSMAQTGMTRGQKKNRRDAIAAAGILRTFLSRLDEEE